MKWNHDDSTLEKFIADGGSLQSILAPGNLVFTEISLPSARAALLGQIESIDTAAINPRDIETARALFGMPGNHHVGGRAA
ncbi:MAG TPA: hypothetical protein VFC46_07750 [Humisphaera sp.]|nr:hypothetical protein [Humisphaera sp.]